MVVEDLNLCKELVGEMRKLEFRESSVLKITGNERYVNAFDKEPVMQRMMLTMLFYNVLISTDKTVPTPIRMSLNVATDVTGWLEDMKLSILPFLKLNEDVFFPVLN